MHKRLAATNLVTRRLHWSLQSGLIFIADWFPTVRRSACQEKGGDFLKHSGDLSVSDEGMNNWHFIDDQLQIGDGFAICHRPVCVLHHFVTSIHINDSSFYCLIISTIGKKTEKLYNQQRIQLQHFGLFFAGRSICNCPAVNILITCREIIQFWKAYFLYAFCFDWFWLVVNRQLVTDQSPHSCNQSTNIRQQIVSLSPYLPFRVADKLQINHWQVAKPVTG